MENMGAGHVNIRMVAEICYGVCFARQLEKCGSQYTSPCRPCIYVLVLYSVCIYIDPLAWICTAYVTSITSIGQFSKAEGA